MAGETRELGRRYTCLDKIAPLWDKSAERVSCCLRELAHARVEEEAPIQEEPAQLEKLSELEAPVQLME